jgi:hypothetical protein
MDKLACEGRECTESPALLENVCRVLIGSARIVWASLSDAEREVSRACNRGGRRTRGAIGGMSSAVSHVARGCLYLPPRDEELVKFSSLPSQQIQADPPFTIRYSALRLCHTAIFSVRRRAATGLLQHGLHGHGPVDGSEGVGVGHVPSLHVLFRQSQPAVGVCSGRNRPDRAQLSQTQLGQRPWLAQRRAGKVINDSLWQLYRSVCLRHRRHHLHRRHCRRHWPVTAAIPANTRTSPALYPYVRTRTVRSYQTGPEKLNVSSERPCCVCNLMDGDARPMGVR